MQPARRLRNQAETRNCVRLAFLNFGGPFHLEASLDALVHRAVAFVNGECAVGFGPLPVRYFQLVAQLDGGDANQLFFGFDAPFDFGFQIVGGGDSARFQRAGQCAGQSTGQCRKQVVDGGRQRLGRLDLVERRIAGMHAKAQRFCKTFDVRFPQRALPLHNVNPCPVYDFAHVNLRCGIGFTDPSPDAPVCTACAAGYGLSLFVLHQREDVYTLQFFAALQEQ